MLGLFSYQRLKVDQFPNIEFPFVVVQVDYPGASPEIVENEVTRKVEEAVNTIAGINQLYSRSYEGVSLVIVQFNLDADGRRAADDVREKLAIVKVDFRDEIKEPRVTHFDPASRPIYSLALTSPDGSRSVQELATFADQVVKKRLEKVRGVGGVTLVGGAKREVNVYLKPAAMEGFGIGVDTVIAGVRTENQDLPAGNLRSRDAERLVQVEGRVRRPDDLADVIVARRGTGSVGDRRSREPVRPRRVRGGRRGGPAPRVRARVRRAGLRAPGVRRGPAGRARAGAARRPRRPVIAGVLCVRGGYGSVQVLPLLDAGEIAAARKPIVGYSDITSLLAFVTGRAGLVAFHGRTVAGRLGRGELGYDRATFLAALCQAGVGERNLDPVFRMTGRWVWAEPHDSSSAWLFNFPAGRENKSGHDDPNGNRAFAVRGFER